MRKVDTSKIPKKTTARWEVYLWAESIGLDVPFEYDGHVGSFKIIERIDNEHIKVLYNNKEFTLLTRAIRDNQIDKLFEKELHWEYGIGDCINDTVNSHKRDLTITNKKWDDTLNKSRNNKWYQYKCNICGYDCSMDDFWINEHKLKVGQGCSCCAGVKVVRGINDIATTEPWMLKYFVNTEDAYTHTRTSHKEILMRCPICGKLKYQAPYRLLTQGLACSNCSDGISYPEKVFTSILDQLGIRYRFQLNRKYFKWCGKFKYDFYLIDYNYIVETHGMQHYELRKGSKFGTLEEIQANDAEKMKLALSNNIAKYIVLDCRYSKLDWIINSINNSILNDILDLQKVDFNRVEQYATSSLFVSVCDTYNQNNHIDIETLSKMFSVSTNRVSNYLNKGTKLGICNYKKVRKNKNRKEVKINE